MNFIIENWQVVVTFIVVALAVGIVAYKFFTQPSKQQLDQVKSWLLHAVTIAEQQLGGSVGKMKLHMTYDMFIMRFPIVSKLITFNTFSLLVDQALIEMREMLDSNHVARNVIENKSESPIPVVVVNNN